MTIPMRVDFAGGWLDVPSLARSGCYIVNCAITPGLGEYPYEFGGGLGGSAAEAIANGRNAIQSELKIAGWQDPAVILETGLCVWRSGAQPILEAKLNPDFLSGLMSIWWTGKPHNTSDLVKRPRNYDWIASAGHVARDAVQCKDVTFLQMAVADSYSAQLREGMDPLPETADAARKYLGSGWGGYALYLHSSKYQRDEFVSTHNGMAVEPYIKTIDNYATTQSRHHHF